MTTLYVDNIAPNLQSRVSVPGHVIQVVSVSSGVSTDTDADYPQASGITASITPSSTSSKIYVVVNVQSSVRNNGTSTNKIGLFGIKNNTSGTELNRSRIGADLSATNKDFFAPITFAELDSPSSTSEQTYEVLFGRLNSNTFNNTVRLNNLGNANTTITLMEIAG